MSTMTISEKINNIDWIELDDNRPKLNWLWRNGKIKNILL